MRGTQQAPADAPDSSTATPAAFRLAVGAECATTTDDGELADHHGVRELSSCSYGCRGSDDAGSGSCSQGQSGAPSHVAAGHTGESFCTRHMQSSRFIKGVREVAE